MNLHIVWSKLRFSKKVKRAIRQNKILDTTFFGNISEKRLENRQNELPPFIDSSSSLTIFRRLLSLRALLPKKLIKPSKSRLELRKHENMYQQGYRIRRIPIYQISQKAEVKTRQIMSILGKYFIMRYEAWNYRNRAFLRIRT